MAGHSHWAGIKHKKAINDAKKGKVFSKLAKLIYTAVKEGGGGNPDDNPRLRLILEKCRQANMPKDNVKRAIEKATDTGAGYESMLVEGYGHGGVSLIVDIMTDNTNRTGPEIRTIFDKNGGKFAKPGCVSHGFQRFGIFTVSKEKATEEKLMEVALDAGAEDVIDDGDQFEVRCGPTDFVAVGSALQAAGIETAEGALKMVPLNTVEIDLETARKLAKLIEKLEDHDDVQDVFHNFDVSEETAKALESDEG